MYLHIDLDVLDPATIDGIGYPEPFGVTAGTAVRCDPGAARRGSSSRGPRSPSSPRSRPSAPVHDLPVILRILGALTGRLRRRARPPHREPAATSPQIRRTAGDAV